MANLVFCTKNSLLPTSSEGGGVGLGCISSSSFGGGWEEARAGNSNWQTSFKTLDNKVGKLYPNPATNQIQLAHYLDANQKGVLNLYDMMGQQLSSYNFMGTGTQTINVANLPTGLYHYTIVVENTTVVKDKIVIIK